jgi:hypothetical protein
MGFSDVGRGWPVLDGEAHRTIAAGAGHNATGTSGHLGNRIAPEMLDNLVKRAGHRRQSGKPLEHRITGTAGFAIEDGVAIRVECGPRREIALAVGERLIELHRKTVREIVEHIFFAVAVYVECGGGRRRFPSVFHDFTPDNMWVRGNVRGRARPAFERR